MYRISASIILLLASIVPAYSQDFATDISVFGIPLQRVLLIPECPYHRMSRRSPNEYDIQGAPKTCFRKNNSYGERSDDTPDLSYAASIAWAFGTQPAMASGSVNAIIIGGLVQGVVFNTHGYSSQEQDLVALVSKFGEPTTISRPEVQNRMGAKYEGIIASWALGLVQVTFNSLADDLDTGLVRVETDTAKAQRSSSLNELHKDAPAL